MACGLLTATAGPAAAAPPDTNRLATWNMQYGPDKWGDLYRLSANHDVVAVQEAPYGDAREVGPRFGPLFALIAAGVAGLHQLAG
ncbi:hypothetical protein ACWGJW_06515 [Streptomyces nigrescens]